MSKTPFATHYQPKTQNQKPKTKNHTSTMEIIVITPPTPLQAPPETANALFEAGLQRLHLRFPDTDRKHTAQWIEQIAQPYRQRIVIHDHHDLAGAMALGGIHLNSRNPQPLASPSHAPATPSTSSSNTPVNTTTSSSVPSSTASQSKATHQPSPQHSSAPSANSSHATSTPSEASPPNACPSSSNSDSREQPSSATCGNNPTHKPYCNDSEITAKFRRKQKH